VTPAELADDAETARSFDPVVTFASLAADAKAARGLALVVTSAALAADAEEARTLARLVSGAVESGDAVRLGRLFPSNRKVRVSLEQIARLEGFVGSGPLIEALRRYVSSRSDVHYDCEPPPGGASASSVLRLRGTLSSRERVSGRRERVGLAFVFERIDGDWRAVEVRETG
jgi:hypothetical protein